MSAENHNPSSPAGEAPEGAAEPSNTAPASARAGVVASHGEREKRAYVAPVEVPRRHQRTNTIDMSKVRISPDMKVQQLDPRHMATMKMDIPPGGIRPPPPPATAEVADVQAVAAPAGAAASPWSQNAGIDRSMLPSAAMAQAPPAQAAHIPSMPPPGTKKPSTSSSVGPAVWIGVIIVAAILGGGVALALRGNGSSGGTEPVSSSAPIAITVPGTTTTTNSDSTAEPEVVDPNSTDDAGGATTTKTAPRSTAPRRTSPATKTTTAAPAPAPAPTVARPRLFN